MSNQIEIWFRLADEDKDGAIAGAEAVKFFTKSGLPQDVLGQVRLLKNQGHMFLCTDKLSKDT